MTHEPEVIEINEPDCGLEAFIVLDDTRRGPCAGGVRTRAYESKEEALEDAKQLARSMTVKCALAGLPVGGGKAVILKNPKLDRRKAFERMGQVVQSLSGRFRTAGDFGTTRKDLDIMAAHTEYVHAQESELSLAVAQGLYACLNACAEFLGLEQAPSLSISVQGCGAIGSAVARLLAVKGHKVCVADLNPNLARRLELPMVDSDDALFQAVDILSPCAIGGVITPDIIPRLRAKAVCGAANNIVRHSKSHRILHEARIPFVPDVLSSAGAVIDGIGETVMGLEDRSSLIDRLGSVTTQVLELSKSQDRPPHAIALEMAEQICEQ